MIGRFFDFAFGWIPRGCRAALGLSGEQRQTLMSWGLIGGIVILTALKLRSQMQIEGRWKAGIAPDIERLVVEGLFDQLGWDTILQGVLVMGLVAIARGGSMTMNISKGGVSVDFQASGQAAAKMGTGAGLAEAMASPTAPANEAPPAEDPKPPREGA